MKIRADGGAHDSLVAEYVTECKEDSIGCEDAAGFMSGEVDEPWVVLHFDMWEEGVDKVVFLALRRPSGMRVIGSCKDPIRREE